MGDRKTCAFSADNMCLGGIIGHHSQLYSTMVLENKASAGIEFNVCYNNTSVCDRHPPWLFNITDSLDHFNR